MYCSMKPVEITVGSVSNDKLCPEGRMECRYELVVISGAQCCYALTILIVFSNKYLMSGWCRINKTIQSEGMYSKGVHQQRSFDLCVSQKEKDCSASGISYEIGTTMICVNSGTAVYHRDCVPATDISIWSAWEPHKCAACFNFLRLDALIVIHLDYVDQATT